MRNFRKFTHYHTKTLLTIFDFNRFIGETVFAFMLTQFPVNTYLLMAVTLRLYGPATTVVFGNFVAMQYVAIVFFHLLSAMYTNKIHQCRKALFAADVRFPAKLNLRAHALLMIYIEKFNTKKKYGLTYGCFGLISFASFAKVSLIILHRECAFDLQRPHAAPNVKYSRCNF